MRGSERFGVTRDLVSECMFYYFIKSGIYVKYMSRISILLENKEFIQSICNNESNDITLFF